MNLPQENDKPNDIARLFRERDDVGADESLLLRPIRHLLRSGTPVSDISLLMAMMPNSSRLPIGAATYTQNKRLVFWPVLPTNVSLIVPDVIDHVTLEYPSERFHATAYDMDGNPLRPKSGRLRLCPNTGLSLWFYYCVRYQVLLDQEQAVQRKVPIPSSDHDRRIQEFSRYTKKLKMYDVSIPQSDGDVICAAVYVATGSPEAIDTSRLSPLTGANFDIDCSNWPQRTDVQMNCSIIPVRDKRIVVLAGRFPAAPLAEVSLGFPRNTT